jgi:hypothetical protein
MTKLGVSRAEEEAKNVEEKKKKREVKKGTFKEQTSGIRQSIAERKKSCFHNSCGRLVC